MEEVTKGCIPRKWTEIEDDRLRDAVKLHGQSNWKLVASHVGSRDNGKFVYSFDCLISLLICQ